MTPTLEELLERGEVEYAVAFKGAWSEAEIAQGNEMFNQGVKMGKRLTLERTLKWLDLQECGNGGGCIVMSVIRRMCPRCALHHLMRAELAALVHGDGPQTVDSEVHSPVPPDRKGSQ